MCGAATVTGMSDWWDWVQAVALAYHGPKALRGGEIPGSTISRKMGMDQSAPNSWRTGKPRPETARRFARAYEVPVLDAFIACGWITADEAGALPTSVPDPTELDDAVLVKEIERRLSDAKKMRGAADGSTAGPGSAAEPLAEGPRGRLKRQQQEVKTKAQKRAESPKV